MKKIAILILFSVLIYACKKHIKESYPDGSPKTDAYVNKAGQYDGTYQQFYQNGKIQLCKNYREGKLHGQCIEFYENGKNISNALYDNDSLIYKRVYDLNGNMTDGYINLKKFNFDTVAASSIHITNGNPPLVPEQVYSATISNPQIPAKYLRLFLVPGSVIYTDSTYSRFDFKLADKGADSAVFSVVAAKSKKQGLLIGKIKFAIKK